MGPAPAFLRVFSQTGSFWRRLATPGLLALAVPCAGQQATVREQTAVHAGAAAESRVTGSLQPGDPVSIDLRLSGGGTSWCGVKRTTGPALSGFADCSKLDVQTASAGPQYRSSRETTISQLLEASRLSLYVRHFTDPGGLDKTLTESGPAPLNPGRIAKAYAESFRPERFRNAVRAELERSYSEELAGAVLKWYRSDTGRRLVPLEAAAVAEGWSEEFNLFRVGFWNDQPPPARAQLIDQLWRVSDYFELQSEVAASVTGAVAGLQDPALPPERRLTGESARTITDRIQRWQLLFADNAKIRFLYAFRSVDDRDIERNVRFWESPEGRWFRGVMQRGSTAAIAPAAAEFAERLRGAGDGRDR